MGRIIIVIIILFSGCFLLISGSRTEEDELFIKALAESYSLKCDSAIEKAQLLISMDPNNLNYFEILFNCFGQTNIDLIRYLSEIAEASESKASLYYALGRAYLFNKDYDKAIAAFSKAYELSKDGLDVAYYLAKAYFKAGKAEDGFKFFNNIDASVWSREIGLAFLEINHKSNVQSILKLEGLFNARNGSWKLADYIREFYFSIDDDAKAREWAFVSLEIAKKDNDKREMADSLSAIAAHSINIGDVISAREYGAKAAESWLEVGDLFQATEWTKNTAMMLLDEGRLNAALNNYKKALDLAKTYNFPIELCLINNSIGFLCNRQLGEQEKALNYFKDALPNCELVNRKSNTLLGIADVYSLIGKFSEAKMYIEESKKILGDKPTPFQEWGLLSSECFYYSQIKDFKTAEQKCNKMMTLQSKSYLNDMISMYINAKLYFQMGDYKRCVELVEKAKEVADLISDFRYQWPTRLLLADSYRKLGKLNEALTLYNEAMDLIEKIRRESATPQFKILYYQNMSDVYNNYIEALWEYYSKVKFDNAEEAEKIKEKAFLIAIKAKGRALSEMLIREREISAIEENSDLKEVIQRISLLQSQIMKLGGNKDKVSELNEKKQLLEKAYMDYQLLREIEESKYIGVGDHSEKFTLLNLQANLSVNEVILEFKIMENVGFCFILNKDRLEWVKIAGKKDIEDIMNDLSSYISNPSRVSKGAFQMASYDIYSKVFKPLEKDIKLAKVLIIAPDDILFNLPFEAILLKAPSGTQEPDYLIKHFAVVYVPSSHIYNALKLFALNYFPKSADNKYKMLLVADPNYNDEYLEHYRSVFDLSNKIGRLKYAAEEAKNILRIPIFSTEKLIDEDANENKLKNALSENYDILHFAVHGLVDRRDPGLSGLLLNPGSPYEDGIFQLFEIEKFKIKSKLVFLSACNSAAGKIYSGEGMLGLSTAFMHSGALRIIGSIWFIDDYSTNLLVKSFYTELAKNNGDFATALRSAQLNLLSKKEYSHPYYWATFRLIGLN